MKHFSTVTFCPKTNQTEEGRRICDEMANILFDEIVTYDFDHSDLFSLSS
jgi:hypothetical protein